MIESIASDLKSAMKSQNKPKITGLRNLLGKLRAKQIDKIQLDEVNKLKENYFSGHKLYKVINNE